MAVMSKLTVLGIGNILMGDEGVGVRLLEAVQSARDWPDSVEFIDGGVGGLNLLNVIEQSERLVVFDAAEMRLRPGQWRIVSPDQVADEDAEGRLSMHETPFIETLELCRELLRAPSEVAILAIQPKELDRKMSLSDVLTGALDELVRAGVELIEESLRHADTEPGNRKCTNID